MAVEILRDAPKLTDGLMPLALAPAPIESTTPKPPRPNYADIPPYLIGRDGEFGMRRAKFLEKRAKRLFSSHPEYIEKVYRNEFNCDDDRNGRDLTGKSKKGSPATSLYFQLKQSGVEVIKYKHKIKENLPTEEENGQLIGPWTKEIAVSEWMTDHNIILLNGSETKSNQDIINSFLPQFNRIQTKGQKLMEHLANSLHEYHARLASKGEIIQIFPKANDGQLTFPLAA
jgi:hypothetical protein